MTTYYQIFMKKKNFMENKKKKMNFELNHKIQKK